jgi:hypothetical protein
MATRADDASIYPAEPRNGEVWVMTTFGHADLAGHWSDWLGSGLAHDVVRQVALFGAQSREGWGVDLTILTALPNLLPMLPGGGSPSRPISWGGKRGCGLRPLTASWSRPLLKAGCGGGQVCATVRPPSTPS